MAGIIQNNNPITPTLDATNDANVAVSFDDQTTQNSEQIQDNTTEGTTPTPETINQESKTNSNQPSSNIYIQADMAAQQELQVPVAVSQKTSTPQTQNNEGIDLDSVLATPMPASPKQEQKAPETESQESEANSNQPSAISQQPGAISHEQSNKKNKILGLALIVLVLLAVVGFFLYRLMFPLGVGTNTLEESSNAAPILSGNENAIEFEEQAPSEEATEITDTGNNQEETLQAISDEPGVVSQEIQAAIEQFTSYAATGKRYYELGRLRRNSEITKYGLYIEKKSLDQLDNLATATELDTVSIQELISQFDQYITLLENMSNDSTTSGTNNTTQSQ